MSDQRSRLAAREAELVRALHGGPTPPGLDKDMIALTRGALARKRARHVTRAFPALARDLGPDYHSRFEAFANANPPHEEGGLADGLAFGASVARERRLSDDARVELMVARSGVTNRRGRLIPRRTAYVAATMTSQPSGIVLVTRLPGLGTRLFSVRAPWRNAAGP